MTVFWDSCQRGILTPIQIKSHNMRYVFILMVFLCTSCGTALPTIKPYKLEVQQGNVVTSKMLLQLRPGMTKSQVRFIMGTPLIQDSFHGNRWDYVYQLREAGKVIEQRRVILDFDNELLKRVRGDVVPSGSNTSQSDDNANIGTRVIKPYVKPEDKSLLHKLMFWKKDEADLPKAAPVENPPSNNPEPKAHAATQKSVDLMKENTVPETSEVKPVSVKPAATPELAVPATLVEQKPVESKQESTSEPDKAVPESSSGMQLERTLKPDAEAAKHEVVVDAPRVGNKTPPKPKDLPVEGTPGFFDRMLEKIGF
ncbi:outer membrane protein assembly factor BamE precursor [mine drainage metagenome]|uniref:Outer membrane protein assembly factor BamE n=1 Tax=mine drainage metagenome TaxID=410659 RepID=A0A1J5SFL9_9ZZZZ